MTQTRSPFFSSVSLKNRPSPIGIVRSSGKERLDAADVERAAVVRARDANIALEFGCDTVDQIALAPDVFDIGIVEPDAAAGALSARLQFRAAAEQDDDVLAQRLRVVALAFLEAVAHRDDQHDRRDAPGDAGHGEKGAQLVAEQTLDDLPEELGQVGHGLDLLQNDLLAFGEAFERLRSWRRC